MSEGGKRVSPDYELSLELPAVHRGVRVARNVIRHFARLWGVQDTEVDTMALVVSELLANTIDHGGGRAAMTEQDLSSDVRMRLSLVIHAQAWELSVTDQGGGDPAELESLLKNTGEPDLEDERGRGLFLLSQMVDRFDVKPSGDGRGITVTVSKDHA